MLRWKKRDEGFEWQKYVRTTIKLRREARRQKAHDLGQSLAEGALAAGAAADGIVRSGARRTAEVAGAAALELGRIARVALGGLGMAVGGLARPLAGGFAPALDLLGRPGVGGPLLLVGLMAIAAGIGRSLLSTTGLDGEAALALGIGGLCTTLGLGPALWHGHSGLPERARTGFAIVLDRVWIVLGCAGLLLAAATALLAPGSWRASLPMIADVPSLRLTRAETIAGTASAQSADQLRIADKTVRLAGIEVPDPEQRCLRATGKGAGRSWACGLEAREALAKLVRGQAVVCEVTAKGAGDTLLARCKAGEADIGAALVRSGHAFAEARIVGSYRAAEEEAKAAKAGIWAASEPERPAAWRDRLWATAKRQAPQGCPIKGRIRDGERIYVLPWSSSYDRVRLSERRGERWFCSEDEAIAAGWRNASRG